MKTGAKWDRFYPQGQATTPHVRMALSFCPMLGNRPQASVPEELFMLGASLSACPANLNISQAMGCSFKRTEDLEDLHNAVRTLDRLLEPDHPPAY